MSRAVRSAEPGADRVGPNGGPAAGLLPRASSEWVALGGVAALTAALVLSPDHIEDGPVLCPFRLVTGLECPGCGMTRAFVYLAHGWWGHAVTANPFGAVVVVAILALTIGVVDRRVRGLPPPDLERLARRPWVRVVLGAWLGFAVARLLLSL